MPAEDLRNNNGAAGAAAEERRNELHLASHEQHRLTTASIIEHGIEAERNKFVYEVSWRRLRELEHHSCNLTSASTIR